jgi:hypothetical protein
MVMEMERSNALVAAQLQESHRIAQSNALAAAQTRLAADMAAMAARKEQERQQMANAIAAMFQSQRQQLTNFASTCESKFRMNSNSITRLNPCEMKKYDLENNELQGAVLQSIQAQFKALQDASAATDKAVSEQSSLSPIKEAINHGAVEMQVARSKIIASLGDFADSILEEFRKNIFFRTR